MKLKEGMIVHYRCGWIRTIGPEGQIMKGNRRTNWTHLYKEDLTFLEFGMPNDRLDIVKITDRNLEVLWSRNPIPFLDIPNIQRRLS